MTASEHTITRRYYRRKLFTYTLLIMLTGALCAAAGIIGLLPATLGNRYGVAITTMRMIEKSLVPNVVAVYAVMTGFTLLAVAVLHLYYSHRIAGPAYRLAREAEEIGRGNLKASFKLRKKDSLTDVAEALKESAAKHRETVVQIDRQLALLEEQARTISGLSQEEGGKEALLQAVAEMTSTVKNIERGLSVIRP